MYVLVSSTLVGLLTKVKVTLQLAVSQPLCQGIEPIPGLVTKYYFLSEGCFLKFAMLSFWGALSDERSGVICLSLSNNLPLFTTNIYVTCVLLLVTKSKLLYD
jgi:hypothetical protein